MNIDAISWKILRTLQSKGRISIKALAGVTDHPNGATHVRPNGATLGCHIPPQTGCIFSLF